MFYEAQSDFFYDPKSTYYYGNKQKKYFRYNASLNPPFQQVVSGTGAAASSQSTVSSTQESLRSSTQLSLAYQEQKPEAGKLHITLPSMESREVRSKSSVDSSSSHQSGSSPPIPLKLASKKLEDQKKNMDVWSKRKATPATKPLPPPTTDATPAIPKHHKQVICTAAGEPICTICVRKFASRERLEVHEQFSELHKNNVLRLQQAAKQTHLIEPNHSSRHNSSKPKYIDRAKKRRKMYGEGITRVIPSLSKPERRVSIPVGPLDLAAPHTDQYHLQQNTLGNDMFQKMVEKAGPVENPKCPEKVEQVDNLRREWERIETLAVMNGRQGKRLESAAGIGSTDL
jgi:hypothetical protein